MKIRQVLFNIQCVLVVTTPQRQPDYSFSLQAYVEWKLAPEVTESWNNVNLLQVLRAVDKRQSKSPQ